MPAAALIRPQRQRGDPPQNLFGLSVVSTTAMTQGYSLVGSSTLECAAIFERSGLMVEASTEHAEFFAQNKVVFRAEERITLAVFRPDALCYGSFSTSPA